MNISRIQFLRYATPIFRRYFAQTSNLHKFIPRYQHKRLVAFSFLSGCGFYLNKAVQSRPVLAANTQDSTVIEEADHLYATGDDPRHLYDYLNKYKETNNAEILWRCARAARDLALKGKDVPSTERKTLVYEAFEISKKALEVDEKNWGSHKWFAITLGDVGDYEGTKIKISNAYIMKDHLERALQLNPNDATTAHCLGAWCLAFAELPWYQQKIASLLFATPPTSTYQEALKMFELAEKIEPNFYSVNLLQLGKCCSMTGDIKRAMLYFDKAINYPAMNDEDREAVKEAKKLLDELIVKNKK